MRKNKKKRLRRISERVAVRHGAKGVMEVIGTIKMTQSGFGFVVPDSLPDEAPKPDIFIPARNISGALDGDRVKVAILPANSRYQRRGDENYGPVGRIIETISRERETVVGELVAGNRLRPLNPRMPDEIIVYGPRKGAKSGDWVELKLKSQFNEAWSGSICSVIGSAGVLSHDLDAIMAEYDVMGKYSDHEEAEAAELLPRDIQRIDCSHLNVLTIDPFDAKDFDDALSLEDDGKSPTVCLGVHISDVAAYIAPKSKFDIGAMLRGFSCYLPGRTLPMLPASLTRLISLRAGKKSLAHSVFLTLDRNTGEVISAKRQHTVISVSTRLNYDEVQEFIDNNYVPDSWNKEVKSLVSRLVDITRKMRNWRREFEQFIELPLPEVRVICDENANTVSGISVKLSREAEQLVEECMLAANQVVGKELLKKSVAGVYRIHPQPAPEKTLEFSQLMAESFDRQVGDISVRKECNRFISSLPDDPRRSVMLNLLLRALPRAGYSTNGDLHFALGKSLYVHFTSPIRRYPDLLVHQQLWNSDQKIRTRNTRTLEKAASWCSEQEENLDSAYYAATDRLKLRYLADQLANEAERIYEGVIVRVISAGLQVEIGELGLFGFVPKDKLRGNFRRRKFGYSQERGDINYKPGNYIYLRLVQIDFKRGEAIFIPAGR